MYDFFISVSIRLWTSFPAICCELSSEPSGIGNPLHIQELRVPRGVLDEPPPGLHRIPHEDVEQVVRLDGVLDRHALEQARVEAHGGLPQLVRVHLSQALVPLHLGPLAELLHGIAELLVGEHVPLVLALLDPVQRGLRDVEVSPPDQLLPVPVEEREQERPYVRAVHVRIRHDAYPVIPRLGYVELGVDAGPQRGYDRPYLCVLEHLVEPGLLHVQNLAPERQDRLDEPVPRLPGRAPPRSALDTAT